MILEYARTVLSYKDAQHAEYEPYASDLFISKLECSLVGREMSLSFAEGSTIASAGTFKLNEAASPKTIDITYDAGPNQGQTALGIYEIRAGNRHRLCIAPPGAARPSKFESRPGSGYVFEEWERVK